MEWETNYQVWAGIGGVLRRQVIRKSLSCVLTLRRVTRIKGHEWCSLIGRFWFCSGERSYQAHTRWVTLSLRLIAQNYSSLDLCGMSLQPNLRHHNSIYGLIRRGNYCSRPWHGSQQRIDAKCRRVPCCAVSIGFHLPETPWIPFEVYIT